MAPLKNTVGAVKKFVGRLSAANPGVKVTRADLGLPEKAPAQSLEQRVTELEGDLVRIVNLLVRGDLDSASFREILTKRQGPSAS